MQAITAPVGEWTERDTEALRAGFVRIRYPDGSPSLEVEMACDEAGHAWNADDRCDGCGADASVPPELRFAR
jgi:hypothetical protein